MAAGTTSELHWSKSLARKVFPRHSSPLRPNKSPLRAGKISVEQFRARFDPTRFGMLNWVSRESGLTKAQAASIERAKERWKAGDVVHAEDEAWALFYYSSSSDKTHDKLIASWVEVRDVDFALAALFASIRLMRSIRDHGFDEGVLEQVIRLRSATAFLEPGFAMPEGVDDDDDPLVAVVAAFLDPENRKRAARAWKLVKPVYEKYQPYVMRPRMLVATACSRQALHTLIKTDHYAEQSRRYLPSAIDIHGAAMRPLLIKQLKDVDFFWARKDLVGEALTAFVDEEVVSVLIQAIDARRSTKPRTAVEDYLVEHAALSKPLLVRAAKSSSGNGRIEAVLDRIG